MELSVLTVTWNSAKYIGDQINSVKAGCEGVSFEQLIADNASSDETSKIIENTDVKFFKFEKNIGFGAANNELYKSSSGEFVLLLNPDMKITPNSMKKLIDWMRQRPKVGVVSCKLVNENGEFNEKTAPRRFPSVFDQMVILMKIHHVFPGLLNSYLFKNFDPGKEQEVDTVQGSFLLIRREMLEKLGRVFDPRYFIWFEDVDLCRETKNLGYEVWYSPIVSAVDYSGKSFEKSPVFWKQQQFSKSMLLYFKKWHRFSWVWIAVFRPVSLVISKVADLFV